MDCLESALAKMLTDLNSLVRYGIVMHIYAYKKLADFYLAVVGSNRQI